MIQLVAYRPLGGVMLRCLLILLLLGAGGAVRAETYHTCTGFITSVPTTITTQGVWCMEQNLSTSINSGAAITIATNNVTVDCNGFKLGGLAAGPSSGAYGIYAQGAINATVRHCNIRGFAVGIKLSGNLNGGHLVEDNRLDQNLSIGLEVHGDGNRIQRNRVYDTGGAPEGDMAIGIYAEGDVIDNTVAGVFAVGPVQNLTGIHLAGVGSEARGNQIRGLLVESGYGIGIHSMAAQQIISSNRVVNPSATDGVGIMGLGVQSTFCTDNLVANYQIGMQGCHDVGGNASHAP